MPRCPFPCNNQVHALFCFQTASMIFQWPLIGTFAKTNGLRSRSNGRSPPSHLCKAQSCLSTIKLAPFKIAPKNSTTRHPAPTSKFWYSEYELGVNWENSYLGKYPMMAANQSHWFAICWFDHIFFKFSITFLHFFLFPDICRVFTVSSPNASLRFVLTDLAESKFVSCSHISLLFTSPTSGAGQYFLSSAKFSFPISRDRGSHFWKRFCSGGAQRWWPLRAWA